MDLNGPNPHPLLKEGKFEIRAEVTAKGQKQPQSEGNQVSVNQLS